MRSPEEINFENVWVFIPAYNSASTLKSTLRDLPSQLKKIIVVDDGSQDEEYFAEELDIEIVDESLLPHFAIHINQHQSTIAIHKIRKTQIHC